MPCYHFDLRGETGAHEGVDLSGIQEARVEAARLVGDILHDAPEAFWTGASWNLDVSNCDHAVLFTLSLTCKDGDPRAAAAMTCPDSE